MMRKQLRVEMKKLHSMLLKMDMLIKNNIDLMIKAIKNKDFLLAENVIKADDLVDKLEIEIEEFCIDILVTQQPVASDLREVTAILKMITDLERISDYCATVCEYFIKIKGLKNEECFNFIITLCKNAKKMFIRMVESYLEQDTSKIVNVYTKDSISDKVYNNLEEFAIKNVKILTLKRSINVILMGRALERMADHITNVCEYINFKITGSFKI